jgi:hypothetical protein
MPPANSVAWGAATRPSIEPWLTWPRRSPASAGPAPRRRRPQPQGSPVADRRRPARAGDARMRRRSRGGLIAADDVPGAQAASLSHRPFVVTCSSGSPVASPSYTNERGVDAATGLRVDRVGWGAIVEHPRAIVTAAVSHQAVVLRRAHGGRCLVSARPRTWRAPDPAPRAAAAGRQRFGHGE